MRSNTLQMLLNACITPADEATEIIGDERNVIEASLDLGSADMKVVRDGDGKVSVIVLASSGHAVKVPADLLCDAC